MSGVWRDDGGGGAGVMKFATSTPSGSVAFRCGVPGVSLGDSLRTRLLAFTPSACEGCGSSSRRATGFSRLGEMPVPNVQLRDSGSTGVRPRRRKPVARDCSAELIEREGGVGDWAEGQAEQGHGVVVAGDSVGSEGVAAAAAVDDGPFAVASDFDGDGLHGLAAGAGAVAGLFVEVAGPEAEGAVVAVAGSGGAVGVRVDVVFAVDAGERRFVGA